MGVRNSNWTWTWVICCLWIIGVRRINHLPGHSPNLHQKSWEYVAGINPHNRISNSRINSYNMYLRTHKYDHAAAQQEITVRWNRHYQYSSSLLHPMAPLNILPRHNIPHHHTSRRRTSNNLPQCGRTQFRLSTTRSRLKNWRGYSSKELQACSDNPLWFPPWLVAPK